MIIILTDFHNNMVTLNEIVIHGSNHTGNTMFGGNLHLMVFSTSEENTFTSRKPTTISIKKSTFSNGIGNCLTVLALTVFECSSGGLTLSFTGKSLAPKVSISINKCKFMGNKAHSSGGISSFMQYSAYRRPGSSNTRIHITKSMFLRNTAVASGDGLFFQIKEYI